MYFLYHSFCFQFGIRGVTYRLTQGVVKRIIPAVASTNAVIAAACAMEVFKLASSCCANHLQNYMVFNDSCGIYTYAYEPEKKEDCLACSQTVKDIQISGDAKLQEFIGQAHHMFSRFLNQRTYEFFSQIFLCFVFLQVFPVLRSKMPI